MKDHDYNQLHMIFVHIQSDLNFFVYLFLQVRKNKKNQKEKKYREIKWWNPFIIKTQKPKKNYI